MTGSVDPTEAIRARAESMVAKGMSDRDIDLEIMYMDSDRRDLIWEYVLAFRAVPATGPSPARDDVTTEQVLAERRRRITAGETYGYKALAAHFHVDSSTIRRRLGKL